MDDQELIWTTGLDPEGVEVGSAGLRILNIKSETIYL